MADLGGVLAGGFIVAATGIITTLLAQRGERRRADTREAREVDPWLRQERARAFANAVASAATLQHLATNINTYTRVGSDQQVLDAQLRALQSVNDFNTAIAQVRIVADVKFHPVVGAFALATDTLPHDLDGEEGPGSKYAQRMQDYSDALAAFTMVARQQLGISAG